MCRQGDQPRLTEVFAKKKSPIPLQVYRRTYKTFHALNKQRILVVGHHTGICLVSGAESSEPNPAPREPGIPTADFLIRQESQATFTCTLFRF
jgi:hypothetical protein